METVQTIEIAIKIALVVICMILVVAVIYYARKCDKLTKQSEIDKGNIERDQVRLRAGDYKIEMLERQIKTASDVIDKATTRYLQQGIEIEMLRLKREKRKELKIAFKKAVDEIGKLKAEIEESGKRYARQLLLRHELANNYDKIAKENAELDEKNGLLIQEMAELRKSKDYCKARANHQKLLVEPVESKWWECKNNNYINIYKGKKYKDAGKHTNDNLIWIEVDNHPNLVNKCDFKPVAS